MLYSGLGLPRHEFMSSPVFSRTCRRDAGDAAVLDAKRQYRDAIVFFRMGDFYEMFYEDALTAARALELTLTTSLEGLERRRHSDVRRALHAADGYIARLVKKGFRVAVCEQMEDPKKAKGLVGARSSASSRPAR